MGEPFSTPGLLDGGWRAAAFGPFRDGVDICVLVEGAPSLALLRYAPGASVPAHRHRGPETVLVLDGAQCDERGRHVAGADRQHRGLHPFGLVRGRLRGVDPVDPARGDP